MPKFVDHAAYNTWQHLLAKTAVGETMEFDGLVYLVEQKADGSRFATLAPEWMRPKLAA